jgi:dihydropyrimidine dehydrogenase (NAD+) subunit PreA
MSSLNYMDKQLVGLQNVEQTSDRPLRANLADMENIKKKWPDRVLIASIMGFKSDEWRELAIATVGAGVDMLELNFSCPHMAIEGAGMKVGQSFELVQRFTDIVRNVVRLPILAKLTSNVSDINEPAIYAKKGGADGIVAINSVRALTDIGLDDYVPKPNVFGKGAMSGYTGPGIKPIALRCIAELGLNKDLGLPLSGCGGIESWVDALEFILCGASTVQMTTGIIHYGYRIVEDMIEGLSDFMEAKGIDSVDDLVGKALTNIHRPDDFDVSRQGVARYDLARCIGCGQCHIVCRDAGSGCLGWDYERRLPVPCEERCYSCMVCSFVCPINDPPLITFKEVEGKKPYIP